MRSPSGGRPPQKRPVEQRASRTVPEASQTQPQTAVPASKKKQGKPGRKSLWMGAAIAGLVLVLALAGFLLFGRSGSMAAIDKSKYQAVFFTNGQVYFGKLQDLNRDYMKLTDVYYLQSQQDGASATDSENPQETSSQQSDVQLVKLGDEIHGPEDAMIVSKQQMLFFENLKADGQVSKSISSHKSSN